MPAQTTQKRTSTPAQAAPAADTTQQQQRASDARGNQAKQDQLAVAAPSGGGGGGGGAGGAGDTSGLGNYQSALGDYLGKELYQAVSANLTSEKVNGYALSAVDAALKALGDAVAGSDKVAAEGAAVDALVNMLKGQLDPLVEQWMEKDGEGLRQSLVGWVNANPRTIASLAILAAAGAILANVEIPELKQKIALGKGLSLDVEAKLGRIRSLALEKVKANLSYTAGPLVAALQVEHAKDGGTTGTGSLTVGDKDREASLKGTFDKDGLKVAGLSAMVQTSAGKLSGGVSTQRGQPGAVSTLQLAREDGPLSSTVDFKWDSGKDTMVLGYGGLAKLDGYDLSVNGQAQNDGSRSLKLGASGKKGNLGWSAGGEVDQTGKRSLSLGGSWKGDNRELSASGKAATDGSYDLQGAGTWNAGKDSYRAGLSASRDAEGGTSQKLSFGTTQDIQSLKLELDASVSRIKGSTKGSLDGKLSKDFGDGRSLEATLKAEVGDKALLELGARYGYKDPNGFRSWLVEYGYNSGLNEQQLKFLIQDQIGKNFKYRAEVSGTYGDTNRKLNTSLYGAYFTAPETAVVAGARYERDFMSGKGQITPEVGVQHKGVQVLFGFNPDNKQATVRLGIAF